MKNMIGIFQGKQAKYNRLILDILYDNGPLTAWEITGKIQNVGKMSLHATLNKRLRSLEKKEYLCKGGKKWLLQFKGIIANLLIQENPKRWSHKWDELADDIAKFIATHSKAFFGETIRINDTVINPVEFIDKNLKNLETFRDWTALSTYCKELMQKGVVNFDVISNLTLLTVMISQSQPSSEQLEALLKDWNIKNSLLQTQQRKSQG